MKKELCQNDSHDWEYEEYYYIPTDRICKVCGMKQEIETKMSGEGKDKAIWLEWVTVKCI